MSSVIHSVGLAVGSLLGISKPAAPPPPPPPPPPPAPLAAPVAPPPAPTADTSAAQIQQATQAEEKAAQQGYWSTILTSPEGVNSRNNQTLLGE